MRDIVYLLAAFAMSYLAFASFALAQKRHWQAATGAHDGKLADKRVLKIGGIVWLAAGCAIVLWREGGDYGPLLWVTQLTVAAFGVVATLSLRPQLLKPFAAVLPRADRQACR